MKIVKKILKKIGSVLEKIGTGISSGGFTIVDPKDKK